MPFQPYDPDRKTRITRQNLPHWRQEGVTYFVTSRLADSLPKPVLQQWKEDRQQWLMRHGLAAADELQSLPEQLQHDFQGIFTAKWHRWLDAGHGECHLKSREIARLLVEEMVKGHPTAQRLDAWVVMPNHFHALVEPAPEVSLGKIMQQWKGASARSINAKLGRTGQLWQDEPFDHIVRSEAQLNHFRRYIAQNPVKAKLAGGSFVVGLGDREVRPEDLLKVAGTEVPGSQSGRDFSP